jgi:hypothetical protein
VDLLMVAVSYTILTFTIIGVHGRNSDIAKAIGGDSKGKVSLAAYLLAVPMAFVSTWISGALFVAVAMMWFLPDRRIEKVVKE